MHRLTAFAVDAGLVLGFAVLGRLSHGGGPGGSDGALGVLVTAWPFLVGLTVGWIAGNARKGVPTHPTFGALVFGTTLMFGMALRGLTGGGTPVSFVLVAALTLAVLLVGWRTAITYTRRPVPK
ncbi:MAG: DUF3054 domain-containing protein [Nocardioides sp.]